MILFPDSLCRVAEIRDPFITVDSEPEAAALQEVWPESKLYARYAVILRAESR